MKTILKTAAVVIGLTAGAAAASPITVTRQVDGNTFGTENLQRTIQYKTDDGNGRVRAGLFQLTGSGTFGDFAAFCVDLFKNFTSPDTYEIATPSQLQSGNILSNIDKLFSSAFAEVDTKKEAAAFQIALWEIIYDDGNTLDVEDGFFRVTNEQNVRNIATGYLSGLAGADMGGFDLTFLATEDGQDLVTTGGGGSLDVVPLPASSLLLIGGLGGLAAMRRRQKKA